MRVDKTKAAIYVRVSKQSQDYQRQISDLQAYAGRQQLEVVAVITEKGSASKRRNADRPELKELMSLAMTKQIDKVLVTEVSRLGRRTAETLRLIEELTDLGISIYSQNFGLETLLPNGKRNPAAGLIFVIYAEIARMETESLSDRIRSGQAEARKKGVAIGRAKGTVKSPDALLADYPKVVKKLQAGLTVRDIAAACGVAKSTVQKVKGALGSTTGEKLLIVD